MHLVEVDDKVEDINIENILNTKWKDMGLDSKEVEFHELDWRGARVA